MCVDLANSGGRCPECREQYRLKPFTMWNVRPLPAELEPLTLLLSDRTTEDGMLVDGMWHGRDGRVIDDARVWGWLLRIKESV